MNPNVPPQGYQQTPQQFYQGTNPWSSHPMMWFAGNNQGAAWLMGTLWFITWIMIVAVLVALFRWLWRKGEEARRK